MNRALFVDRDGVVNELVFYPSHGEWESPRSLEDLRMRSGVSEALSEAVRAGWMVFLISNQPSYAKGKCSLESLQQIHEAVLQQLRNRGVAITESYVCYHHPDSTIAGFGACQYRKPSPFFIREAARTYDLDLASSWMIGDQDTDIETGQRAGCQTASLLYEHSAPKRGARKPDMVCADLGDFVRKVVAAEVG
jgi:D-glycero-D-manno-heptose 1,7-bisphosphate phosphatase